MAISTNLQIELTLVAFNLIHFSDSVNISTIVATEQMLQGIEPLSFQVINKELLKSQQVIFMVNHTTTRSKVLTNGQTMILNLNTTSDFIKNLKTKPQLISFTTQQLESNWIDSYNEKIRIKNIDFNVSIALAASIVFLLLVYHSITFIKKLRK